jgi:hypothetical protein
MALNVFRVEDAFAGDAGRFRFASLEEARVILSASDAFIAASTPFDRAVRTRTAPPPSRSEFARFLADQARAWPAEERSALGTVLLGVDRRLSRFEASLPAEIRLVRTTDQVEAGAPHTRAGAIVLPASALAVSPSMLLHALFHETFHLITQADPALRDELYSFIGFASCKTLTLPDDLAQHLITNPDAPRSLHFIRVVAAGRGRSVVPLLVGRSDGPANPSLFESFQLRFLEVEPGASACTPVRRAAGLAWFDVAELTGFFEQIGTNTQYILHPEEVLADTFALLMADRGQLRSPEIANAIERALSDAARRRAARR